MMGANERDPKNLQRLVHPAAPDSLPRRELGLDADVLVVEPFREDESVAGAVDTELLDVLSTPRTPTDRFIERLETSGKLSFPRASSDGSTEPVVPRTSREHLATSNRSVDLGGTSVAEYRKQQLVVDDYQVGELLHSEVGISLGDSDQSTLVATVALPFGNHRACLVSEHRLQRSNLTGRQLPRGGGTGTTALNNPSEVRIK